LTMRNTYIGYLIIAACILLTAPVNGQQKTDTGAKENRILLNEVGRHKRVPLREAVLYVSAKSLRQEELQCKIAKGNEIIKEISLMLDYGMNEAEISLTGLEADLEKGAVFHFHFQGRYFGKGGFELYMDHPPVMTTPVAHIQTNPTDVKCDMGLASSIEFLGNVEGGTAPYKLTWLVSKGPYVKDLINQPLEFKLATNSDISRMVVAEALDYYVTLLVEDACGNNDKMVVHLTCRENEEDGIIYFQPIELDKTTINSGL